MSPDEAVGYGMVDSVQRPRQTAWRRSRGCGLISFRDDVEARVEKLRGCQQGSARSVAAPR